LTDVVNVKETLMSHCLFRGSATALVLLAAAASPRAADPAPASPAAAAAVAAVVNGAPIPQREVNALVDRVLAANAGKVSAEQLAAARAQVASNALENLIMQKLLLHEVEQAGINVTSNDLAQARREVPLPPGMTFEQALEKQHMTAADFADMVRIKHLLDAKAVAAEAVSDADVKKYYDENQAQFKQPETVTARHILVKVPEGADAKVRADKQARAEDIRQKLLQGGDFAALAKEYSEDTGSKDKGGEYTFPRGQMVAPFEAAAFSNELNKIGPLVETQYGYHILQTTARHPAKAVPLAEVSGQLRKYLASKARGEVVEKYLKQLRADAKVEIPASK